MLHFFLSSAIGSRGRNASEGSSIIGASSHHVVIRDQFFFFVADPMRIPKSHHWRVTFLVGSGRGVEQLVSCLFLYGLEVVYPHGVLGLSFALIRLVIRGNGKTWDGKRQDADSVP